MLKKLCESADTHLSAVFAFIKSHANNTHPYTDQTARLELDILPVSVGDVRLPGLINPVHHNLLSNFLCIFFQWFMFITVQILLFHVL